MAGSWWLLWLFAGGCGGWWLCWLVACLVIVVIVSIAVLEGGAPYSRYKPWQPVTSSGTVVVVLVVVVIVVVIVIIKIIIIVIVIV